MESTPKIKLPVPYKSLKKIDAKLKSLSKIGTEKILTFLGSNEVETMFYLYLFKKYKSGCFLHDKNSGSRLLGMSILINEMYEPQEMTEIRNQLDNLSKILVDCITNLETKIIIIPVQLRFSNGGAHANVLIYRKKLNQIEHFEPHGQKFSSREADVNNLIIEKWMKYFVLKINIKLLLIKQPEVKFIESSKVCPYIDGLQNLEGWSNLTTIAGVEPLGYCVAWSMFFTELCLKNPEIPSSVLMNYIFHILQDMSNTEKKNYLKSIIRGYSVFINQKISKYFSVFFKSGLTIEKIKNLPHSEVFKFRNILRYLIDIEMNLSTNPLYLTSTLKRLQTKLTNLNERLNLNSNDDAIKKEIQTLTNKKNIFEMYNAFNVFSNPTDSLSYSSLRKDSCPEGKELNLKTNRCIKTKTQKVKVKLEKVNVEKVNVEKQCPEGKELNLKTNRCIKTKTQKVKVKLEKVNVEKVNVEKVNVEKQCPEGKELNLKTNRCIKTKTQKVKVKLEKVNVEKRCPEGKELNLKTNRCVKTKTQKVKTRKQKIKM